MITTPNAKLFPGRRMESTTPTKNGAAFGSSETASSKIGPRNLKPSPRIASNLTGKWLIFPNTFIAMRICSKPQISSSGSTQKFTILINIILLFSRANSNSTWPRKHYHFASLIYRMPFQELINNTKLVDEKFIDDQMVNQIFIDSLNNPKFQTSSK